MKGKCKHCDDYDVLVVTEITKEAICPECYNNYLDSLTSPTPLRQDVDDERKYGKYL
jgi:hypothetical protein